MVKTTQTPEEAEAEAIDKSAAALLDQIDTKRDRGVDIPNGYRIAGIALNTRVRTLIEERTGVDASEMKVLLYRDTQLFYSSMRIDNGWEPRA